MKSLIEGWDGEFTVARHDGEAGAWIFIAVHSTRLGLAVGGTRMKVYDTPEDGLYDAQRLAEGMTFKWAAIDFPLGGGKGVIALSRELEEAAREGLLERYGGLVESLRGAFGTGVDMGVGPGDVDVIGRRTSFVFGRTPEAGGSGDPGPWTALGVSTGMEVALAEALGDPTLEGRTVAIQGVGDVGVPLARRLGDAGANLLLADLDPGRSRTLAEQIGAEWIPADQVYQAECDVFAPCAVGGVLNSATIPALRCGVVAGSANNQLESREDAGRLHQRGILYAPDFIINAGGAIAHAGLEALGMEEDEIRRRTLEIGTRLAQIFGEAREKDESPLHAAERAAIRVLERGPLM